MARTPTNFANTTQLSTTAADVVPAVATNASAVVRKVSFYNSGTSTRTVTVYVVAAAGTAGTTNILKQKAITPGDTWNCLEIQGEVLNAGMKVQAAQDVGTDVNVNCSGTIVT